WTLVWVESAVGLLLILGFQTRLALIVGGLMMAALTFGTMQIENFQNAWLQLTYALVFFVMLTCRSWNLISLDALFGSPNRDGRGLYSRTALLVKTALRYQTLQGSPGSGPNSRGGVRCLVAASYAAAIRNSVGSPNGRPMKSTPTGSVAAIGPT